MRLRKSLNRVAAGKKYFRWLIDVPPKLQAKLNWENGEELIGDVRGTVLRVWAVNRRRPK